MVAVRCPHCRGEFQGEASVDGNYRVMHCPQCNYPMSDPIVPFLQRRERGRGTA